MAKTVGDVMTREPITAQASAPAAEAARQMRDSNIGGVIVQKDGRICGFVTDRDLVVRIMAEGKDPSGTPLEICCSKELTTIAPSRSLGDAVKLMREKAVRRLPVVENGKPVGIVSLGDLAMNLDQESALADVSAAPPNH